VTATVIEVDRLPLTFVTTAPADRAELVWRRARDALVGALPAELGAAFGSALDQDDSYVFVDRLDVTCAIRSDWPADEMASAFADTFARLLQLQRERGGALVFRDRAEFVSAFLASVVDGNAFGRWWFSEFDGLRQLTPSAAVRTVVNMEHDGGWEALARLTPEVLLRLVSSLDKADAKRMLAGLPTAMTSPAERLVDAVRRTPGAALPGRSHRVVIGLVDLVRSGGGTASAGNAIALTAVVRLIEAARGGRLAITASPVADMIGGWCETAGLDDAERTAALGMEPAVLVELITALLPDGLPIGATDRDGDQAEFAFTPFGGALLLAVVLVRTGRWGTWRNVLRGSGDGDRADALAAELALRVVARALRPRQPSLVERDAAIRRVFGLPAETMRARTDKATTGSLLAALAATRDNGSTSSVGESLAAQMHASARALLREFGRGVPGCDGSSPAYLRARCLSQAAAVSPDGTTARLGRAPLDVLLGLAGLKRASITFPDARRLVLSEEAAW
jgi:hypothetical protein